MKLFSLSSVYELLITLVYLRMRPGVIGWWNCLRIRTVPIKSALFWLFEFHKVQVNEGSLGMLTEVLAMFLLFSLAHGTVILTSHFETIKKMHTDCTMLSLIGVFGEISFWFVSIWTVRCFNHVIRLLNLCASLREPPLDVCLSPFCTR